MALQKPPIWLNDHFCQRSRPADCIRAGLQPRKLTVHVIIHQRCALIGFLQRGINDDAPGDVLQFHNGRTDHEGNISGACDRQNRLGVHASRIRDDRPGSSNRDVCGGISIEKRITAEVDGKGAVRIAPGHLFKRDANVAR